MCYSHPNGKSSVLQLSDVICWESDEHTFMVIFGLLMIGTMCLYWCFLLYITWVAPSKAKEETNGLLSLLFFMLWDPTRHMEFKAACYVRVFFG